MWRCGIFATGQGGTNDAPVGIKMLDREMNNLGTRISERKMPKI